MKADLWVRNKNFLQNLNQRFYSQATGRQLRNPQLTVEICEEGRNLITSTPEARCFLHSSFDVEREMREMFKNTGGREDILIIFGLGMGYCLDYIRRHGIEYQKVIVLEPYNNIMRELLKRREIAPLLKMPNVSITLFSDPREVTDIIVTQGFLSPNIKVLYHLAYRSLFPELFEEITRLVASNINSLRTGVVTMDSFLLTWTRHQLHSLRLSDRSASILYGKFTDVPAIVVSAGPSLEKQLELLSTVGDRALIMAPGSGARILGRRGIKAHLAMGMDSHQHEVEILQEATAPVLIGSYRLNPAINQAFPGEILRFINSNEYLVKYFFKYLQQTDDTIRDFSSVSSSALEYLVKLGCNPIIIIGQDLCYYDHKTHADEEADSLQQKVRDRLREATDINGQTVYTDTPFLAMQHDMEKLNREFGSQARIINATEAGLGIPGMEQGSFREAVQRFIKPGNVDAGRILQEALKESGGEGQISEDQRAAFFEHLRQEIRCLQDINEEKLLALRELKQSIEKGTNNRRIRERLEEVREKNRLLEDSPLYQTVVMGALGSILFFYRAGVEYQKDSARAEDPASEMLFQTQTYQLSSRYLEYLQKIVEELLAEGEGGQA